VNRTDPQSHRENKIFSLHILNPSSNKIQTCGCRAEASPVRSTTPHAMFHRAQQLVGGRKWILSIVSIFAVSVQGTGSLSGRETSLLSAFGSAHSALQDKSCSAPPVSCQVNFDENGVKFCRLNDTRASCLKPTDKGCVRSFRFYMFRSTF
jgi:hypothetical protein